MAKRYRIILSGMMLLLLLGVCSAAWSEEDKIAAAQKRISALEEQKTQLETDGKKLIAEGDELSLKIDSLKMQAKGGLGIIGRYKLSRSLRKAQALSKEIQSLEKRIQEIEGELSDERKGLEEEYDRQIAVLLEKLNGDGQTEKRAEILDKLKEYQAAKEQLKKQEKEKLDDLGHLDIAEIEIQEYDGPQEIREKADLINDFATKLQNRMDMLNSRAAKLEVELKTRERLGEFAEEISFFGERISRDEVVSDAGEKAIEKADDTVAVDEPITLEGTDARMPITEGIAVSKPPIEAEPPPAESPDKLVVERNGVSASFAVTSLEQIRKEIELLGEQEQDLRKQLAVLMEKASSFYNKADEIEKSETKEGGQKGKNR